MILLLTLSTGCFSGSKKQTSETSGENEPVTLTIRFGEDKDFIEAFIEPAEEEFEHIDFELVDGELEELIAGGTVPDILFHWGLEEYDHISFYELNYDLTELIEKANFDLSRFDENHLDEWRAQSPEHELWGLPNRNYRHQLVYNKEIFDRFGEEYPTDGMNWDEVIDLAKRVTGEIDGTEYQGLYMPNPGHITWTAGDLFDPETDEPLWTENDEVREYFEMYREAYSIPGNPHIPEHWEEGGWPELFEQGRLAMVPTWEFHPAPEANIDWDLVTYPGPNNDTPGRGWGMSITAPSEHKEEAMEVFKFWFSDEQLLNNTFLGPITIPYQHLYDEGIAQERILEQLGDIYEGKNLDALFQTEVAEPKSGISEYESDELLFEALKEYATENIDLNTLMREKYEEEGARIANEKEQK